VVQRWIGRSLVGSVVLGAAAQAVPFGWWHENPTVRADAPWPGTEAAALARTSCYACHSNETDWPAYSYVAPASWLVRRDVEAGREELNFSEWGERSDPGDAADAVIDGEMPPARYTALHRSARLSDDERRLLVAALEAMDDGGGRGDGGDDGGQDDSDDDRPGGRGGDR
jgi:hypothetical protein